jgi:hypothetical protein
LPEICPVDLINDVLLKGKNVCTQALTHGCSSGPLSRKNRKHANKHARASLTLMLHYLLPGLLFGISIAGSNSKGRKISQNWNKAMVLPRAAIRSKGEVCPDAGIPITQQC